MPDLNLVSIALLALVAQIPFEFRFTLLGLSNLQWTFVALALLAAPNLLANWKPISSNRLVQAAALFVALQWLAALYAPELHVNALKAAARFTGGLVLLIIAARDKHFSDHPVCASKERDHFVDGAATPPLEEGSAEACRNWSPLPSSRGGVDAASIKCCEATLIATDGVVRKRSYNFNLFNTWVIASVAAAIYALAEYAGFGFPWLFRTQEFYIGQIRRLSGSFEYPNTAAAYFAMSLPIVWWSSFRPALRTIFAFFLWCAIVLTFSKGALFAVPLVVFAAKPKAAIPLLAAGAAAYAALLPLNPYLVERIYGPGVRNPIAVEYTTPWNKLEAQPHTKDVVPLHIRNTGVTTLRSQGWWRAALAYRWWNMDTESFISTTPIITPLPHNLPRGETLEVGAVFQTPDQPGRYLLVFELFSRNFDWFSTTGVIPTLIQTNIQPSAARVTDQIDLASIYKRGRDPSLLTATVPRGALWMAALKMFLDHPFGVGPDNFRLEYGKYLGVTRWDTHVYSNNLFLEVLTGSGILGLASFLFLLTRRQWNADAPSLAAVVFLVHGLVDVFLMATPIYFAFWLLLGTWGTWGRTPNSGVQEFGVRPHIL